MTIFKLHSSKFVAKGQNRMQFAAFRCPLSKSYVPVEFQCNRSKMNWWLLKLMKYADMCAVCQNWCTAPDIESKMSISNDQVSIQNAKRCIYTQVEVSGQSYPPTCTRDKRRLTCILLRRELPASGSLHSSLSPVTVRTAKFDPLAAGPPRHPLAAGGHIVATFTSATISSQREEIKKRNFSHIFLNT